VIGVKAMQSRTRFVLALTAVFAAIWGLLAIDPSHRDDWLLENVLVVLGIGLLAFTYRSFPLSRLSYAMLFVFLLLHAVGAHYTYAEVPYEAWSQRVFGSSINEWFGWERNNFDRVVHFSYGLLLAFPIREVFLRVANVRGFWGYFLPLDLTMSTSMLYELIEWGAAEVFGGELGAAFLGSQGDVWDAHKDMALASLGALITLAIAAAVSAATRRDFAAEWADSLRVKHSQPLGE
jgi:putative membrane protein